MAAAVGLLSAAVSAACIWEPRSTRNGAARPGPAPAVAAPWSWERLARSARRSGQSMAAVARTPTFLIILVENISNLTRATGGYQVSCICCAYFGAADLPHVRGGAICFHAPL